jgi:hypothetical protein
MPSSDPATEQQAPTTPTKKRKLTKKQCGFVKDYLETGNGTRAALKNYDTTDENTAAVIASENLRNPKIASVIEETLSDDKLAKAHEELLNQARFEYFVFPTKMDDKEIAEKVAAVGVELIVIQPGEKGKYAFFKTIDAAARKSALDMAYKLKGTYAPEKKLIGHFSLTRLRHGDLE